MNDPYERRLRDEIDLTVRNIERLEQAQASLRAQRKSTYAVDKLLASAWERLEKKERELKSHRDVFGGGGGGGGWTPSSHLGNPQWRPWTAYELALDRAIASNQQRINDLEAQLAMGVGDPAGISAEVRGLKHMNNSLRRQFRDYQIGGQDRFVKGDQRMYRFKNPAPADGVRRRTRQRPRHVRNPMNPSASMVDYVTAAAAGGFVSLLLQNVIAPVQGSDWQRIVYQDRITKGDFLRFVAVPLVAAIAWGMATRYLEGSIAFLAGEVGATVLTGGRVVMTEGLPVLLPKPPGPVDLGGYGAPGFAWDMTTKEVFTIREGVRATQRASSPQQAAQIAKQEWGF